MNRQTNNNKNNIQKTQLPCVTAFKSVKRKPIKKLLKLERNLTLVSSGSKGAAIITCISQKLYTQFNLLKFNIYKF